MNGIKSEKRNQRFGYLRDRAHEFCAHNPNTNFTDDDLRSTVIIAEILMDEKIRPLVAHAENQSPRLCRHKIISATQCAIMMKSPIRCDELPAGIYWGERTRKFNARFAQKITLDMLERWLAHYHKNDAIKFLTHERLVPIFQQNFIWLENLRLPKNPREKHEGKEQFNFLIVAQLWSAVELTCETLSVG